MNKIRAKCTLKIQTKTLNTDITYAKGTSLAAVISDLIDLHTWSADELAKFQKPAAPSAEAVPDEWELLPQDLRTHLGDFRAAVCRIVRDGDENGYWAHQLYVIDRIAEQIKTGAPSPGSTRDGLELAAKYLEDKAQAYHDEHSWEDPETGSTEYPGNGADYYNDLLEQAEAIRGLAQ